MSWWIWLIIGIVATLVTIGVIFYKIFAPWLKEFLKIAEYMLNGG